MPVLQDFLPGSSDVDWCETNYARSRYLAEYYNTISNVGFVALPALAIYLFRSYSKHVTSGIDVIWVLLIVVGLGSAYFHGTLSFAGQLIDELAIAWVLLASFAIWTPKRMLPEIFRRDRKKLARIITVVGLLTTVLAFVKPVANAFVLISVSIPVAIILYLEMQRCCDKRAWRLLWLSVFLLVMALGAWLSDKFACSLWLSVGFPYLHSIWHLLILGCAYLASVLCAYLYAIQETPHLKPSIVFWPSWMSSGIPYVRIVESIAA